jgi:hypothetical protein
MGDTDTFAAMHTMTRFFRPLSTDAAATWGVGFGRASEPSLDESRSQFIYRGAVFGFGLEGVDGAAAQDALTTKSLDWLLDKASVTGIGSTVRGPRTLTLTASVASSVGASFSTFRWDFGDGSPVLSSGGPVVEHRFTRPGRFTVRVEVTDSLGHRALGSQQVVVSAS